MGADGVLWVERIITERSVGRGRCTIVYGRVKTKGEKVWETFTILPCIRGQKYTIGTNYKSREEQGEFIFLSPKQLVELDKKGDPLVEITCEENESWWITPKGGNNVYKNGRKIDARRGTQLKFGDNVSFDENKGIEPPEDAVPERVRFVFKKRELLSSAIKKSGEESGTASRVMETIKIGEAVHSVLNNELILDLILEYLYDTDLANARLVSQLWSKEAFKLLRRRYAFNPGFSYHRTTIEKMKLFQYDSEMSNNPLDNWEINLPPFEDNIESMNGSPRAKAIDDLKWFLSKHRNIKSLYLGGQIYCQLDFDVRLQLLQLVQETIQVLELSEFDVPHPSNINYSFPTPLNFPKLQNFALAMTEYGQRIRNNAEISPLFHQIIPAIAGVTAIHLDLTELVTLLFLRNLPSFPNLSDISIKFINLAGWEELLKFGKPLKRLQVRNFGFEEEEYEDGDIQKQVQREIEERSNVRMFEDVLKKHSNTLEILKFGIGCLTKNITMHIPAMPKLKIWKITSSFYCNAPLKFKFVFGGPVDYGTINYVKHFPALHSLTVNLPIAEDTETYYDSYSESCNNFLEIFFPLSLDEDGDAVQQICKTLQLLVVRNFTQDYDGIWPTVYPRRVFSRAEEIKKMFPNIANDRDFLNTESDRIIDSDSESNQSEPENEPEPIRRMVLRSASK